MGRAAYDAMLRDEQLLPFNSDDIELMARDELAHGWADKSGWRISPRLVACRSGRRPAVASPPGGPALIDYYRARIAQLGAFVIAHQSGRVPSWLGPIHVVETPPFFQPVTPGASMNPPLVVQRNSHRLLLHNASDVTRGGGEESGCQ